MHSPTVSVIIRTTHRPTLAAAITSVERQTHRPLELVLIDAVGDGFPAPIKVASDIAVLTHTLSMAPSRMEEDLSRREVSQC